MEAEGRTGPPVVTVPGGTGADVQAALDTVAPGGTVHLRAGRYRVSEPVRLPSHVTLAGEGPAETVLALDPHTGRHLIVNQDPGDGNVGIRIRDLGLDGDGDHQEPPFAGAKAFAFGVFLRRVTDVRIERVDAWNIRQSALQLNECRTVVVREARLTDLGWSGIGTSRSDDVQIGDVVVTRAGLDTRHSGIHLGGCVGGYIEATVERCTGNGIMLDAAPAPVRGVVVRGAVRRAQRGLAVLGGDHEVSGVVVGGRYVDNEECGVLVSNAVSVAVVDALIRDNGAAGIVLRGRAGARDCLLAGCRIEGHTVAVSERDGSAGTVTVANRTGAGRAPDDSADPSQEPPGVERE